MFVDIGRPTREQMAYDERLAAEALPTVRCFVWEPPAISLGWKQSPSEWLKTRARQAMGLAVVERPTGGGIAFHGSDVSVSVIVPHSAARSLHRLMRAMCHQTARLCETYAVSAEALIDVDTRGHVTHCLTELSPYAVLLQGRKVAGFALRRYPSSWLIQGSLLVRRLPQTLMRRLPAALQEELRARAISLSEAAGTPLHERDVAARWTQHWSLWWEACIQEVGDADRNATTEDGPGCEPDVRRATGHGVPPQAGRGSTTAEREAASVGRPERSGECPARPEVVGWTAAGLPRRRYGLRGRNAHAM